MSAKEQCRRFSLCCGAMNVMATLWVLIDMVVAHLTRRHSGAMATVIVYVIVCGLLCLLGMVLGLCSDRWRKCLIWNLSFPMGLLLVGLLDAII